MNPIRFYFIVIAVILCDQVTKMAILKSFMVNESRPIIGSVLSLTYTQNTGGAFSLFQASNGKFIIIASLAAIALLYTYHRFQRGSLSVSVALSLALGGAFGNLIDRVRLGFVVDFFDIHIWPVFNIADSAISVGIVLLAWHSLMPRRESAPVEPAAPVAEG